MSIPASNIVQVNPGVIGGGGASLALNGLILTDSILAVPWGTVMEFPTAASVGDFFGLDSDEMALAEVYFGGRNNKTITPANLLFSQHTAAATAAFLRGGSLKAMTVIELETLTGDLTLTVDGDEYVAAAIDMDGVTTFSQAAGVIEAAFTTPNFSVTYDSQRNAMLFVSDTTGATSTITAATGTLAETLKLTVATGAALAQGRGASGTVAETMDAVMDRTLNWGCFMTSYEPGKAVKKEFSAWNTAQNNRFAYVMWETGEAAVETGDTTLALADIIESGDSGTVPVFDDYLHAAFVLGTAASIDFNRHNGRITFAFKYLSGLTPSVTDSVTAANLEGNGYNFIGKYATANQGFTFFYPGSVTGPYMFLDEYLNQVFLNSQFQLALMTLLTSANSIPYNADGRAFINAACADPINQAINFGSVRGGVSLSELQKALVNDAAGVEIAQTLATRGWYLQVLDATSQVRALRGSPPMTFWYMDGGSVQRINLSSIVIQ